LLPHAYLPKSVPPALTKPLAGLQLYFTMMIILQ
jgi:hypothetical protein